MESWRRKIEGLHYFARQRGNAAGLRLKNCAPCPVSRGRLHSQARGCDCLVVLFMTDYMQIPKVIHRIESIKNNKFKLIV